MSGFLNKSIDLISRIFPLVDHINYDGSSIPLPRKRLCGTKFRDNHFFVKSAESEALRLVENFGCNSQSTVLDLGCGQGRLAIGLMRVVGEVDYIGLDVDLRSVEWCKRNLQRKNPSFKFVHMNVYNERYNNTGQKLGEDFQFDFSKESFDIVYLYSVFSHMIDEEIRIYLREIHRILKDNGHAFFTAFVEEDVPNISINPDRYAFSKVTGPLHVVRYNKSYFVDLIESMDFKLKDFSYGTETDRQSGFYLEKRKQK